MGRTCWAHQDSPLLRAQFGRGWAHQGTGSRLLGEKGILKVDMVTFSLVLRDSTFVSW